MLVLVLVLDEAGSGGVLKVAAASGGVIAGEGAAALTDHSMERSAAR